MTLAQQIIEIKGTYQIPEERFESAFTIIMLSFVLVILLQLLNLFKKRD